MNAPLTKKEICQKLRKRCWRRINWMWYNFSILAAKNGVTLREAASLEAMTSSEDLSERPANNNNQRKVKVSYVLVLKPHEFDGIVALAKEWGYDSGSLTPLILHLGDHDPSGKDMTRDVMARLSEFSGENIEVKRLALNMDQIEQYHPPPNPAKITDSRAQAYIAQFGDESWELDALTPEVMADLIQTAVLEVRDEEKWDEAKAEEAVQKAQLKKVSVNWDNILVALNTKKKKGK